MIPSRIIYSPENSGLKPDQKQIDLFNTAAKTTDKILGHADPGILGDTRSWPRTLADLVDVIADHLETSERMDPDVAMEKAQDIILVLSHYLGGQAVYLPKGDKIKRAVRDAAIYRAFNGSNHLELAKRSGLTPARIYAILDEQRKLRESRQQMNLPFPE
jgi:Mor family transcriptional regulator